MALVVKDRICRQCGAIFPGGPRAWYCPSCRWERQKEQNRLHKKMGPLRPLGSTDHCKVCGGEYIVESGRQMYCKNCAPDAIRQVDNQQAREWNEKFATPEYRKAIRERLKKPKYCQYCGKEFMPTTAATTCSKECSDALKRRTHAQYEQDNKNTINAKKRDARRKKLESMSPEELAEYRAERNAKAREARKKRLEAMTPEELAEYRANRNAKNRENERKRKERKNLD